MKEFTFRNGLAALQECAIAIEDRVPQSGREKEARGRLIHLCADILSEVGITAPESEIDEAIKLIDGEA